AGIALGGDASAGQTLSVVSTGTLTSTGDITLAGSLIKLGGTSFIDDTLTIVAPVMEIVTGPALTQQFGCDECKSAADIAQLAAKTTFNDGFNGTVFFTNLQAQNTEVLIDSGAGAVSGALNVKGLGLAGQGALANLSGSIGGIGGSAAANIGIHTPKPD